MAGRLCTSFRLIFYGRRAPLIWLELIIALGDDLRSLRGVQLVAARANGGNLAVYDVAVLLAYVDVYLVSLPLCEQLAAGVAAPVLVVGGCVLHTVASLAL